MGGGLQASLLYVHGYLGGYRGEVMVQTLVIL
jgi:hypothetical protein